MRTSNELLLLKPQDFELSEQLTSTATVYRIIGVDWQRIFKWESGSVNTQLQEGSTIPSIGFSSFGNSSGDLNVAYQLASSLPVIGTIIKGNAASYALANLMKENPGYDMIIYPQYYRTIKGFPFFFTKTEVVVTARLGKLKNE